MNAICIGASHAGVQFAVSMRQNGWEGHITLISDEEDLPYHRPPLSKDYLSGNKSIDEIWLRSAEGYESAGITLKLGTRAAKINRADKTVETTDGEGFGA